MITDNGIKDFFNRHM